MVSPLLPLSAYTITIMLVMGIHMPCRHLCIHILLNRALEMTNHATISMRYITEHNIRYFRPCRCNQHLMMCFEGFCPLLHTINVSTRCCCCRMFRIYQNASVLTLDTLQLIWTLKNIDCHNTVERLFIGYIKVSVNAMSILW